jgi:selenide,water dikinase
VLGEILKQSPLASAYPDLLVGTETSDDAAVYRLNERQAIVATTDFFLPIVDDPYDFGRIAATNAISDVYAMGGKPIFALALLGVPMKNFPREAMQGIVAGGHSVCDAAGIPIAGGHSIDSPEPFYGLVALGLVRPDRVKRNDQAHAGDVLILGKGLGIGIMGAALKKGELKPKAYAQMLETTTQLNTPGIALSELAGVHAMTDVTGFGLLGHLLEICRGSQLRGDIEFERLPILSAALHLLKQGYATGASERNWESCARDVTLPQGMADWKRKLLCDPQTSGGLLVACTAESAGQVLSIFQAQGFKHAREIGKLVAGPVGVTVR